MSIFSDNNLDINNMQVQAEIKAISKAVGKSLAGDGHKVPHSVVLHAISAALAQRNWHQLKAAIDSAAGVSAPVSQAVTATEQSVVEAERVLSRLEDLPGDCVEARFYTDDRVFEVKFDARTFLATATPEKLIAIYMVGFSGDYCTDDVADYHATHWAHTEEGARIQEAFAYLCLRNQAYNADSIGFECRIDGESFLKWLDACRPDVAATLLCQEYGVKISQSQDEGDLGKWTWYYAKGGMGCEVSFDTELEAKQDAYRVCQLMEQELENY